VTRSTFGGCGTTLEPGWAARTARMTGWLIYACRTPYAAEVVEVIWRRNEAVALLVDNLPDADIGHGDLADADDQAGEFGAPVVGPGAIGPDHHALPVVIPLLTPGHRFTVEAQARALGLHSFPSLVDPTAVIARSAAIGEGSVVNAAVVVAAGATVGRFVHLNRSASVGHHSVVDDYATLGPGCVLAGQVQIGRGAFIGAGAVCAPHVSIGPNALVGAGAVIVRDVPAGAVMVGNPAAVLRADGGGYGGVSVP
jgi:sugar O-acyltransferase (sialic acid O-acetyltransferase NeuD family)